MGGGCRGRGAVIKIVVVGVIRVVVGIGDGILVPRAGIGARGGRARGKREAFRGGEVGSRQDGRWIERAWLLGLVVVVVVLGMLTGSGRRGRSGQIMVVVGRVVGSGRGGFSGRSC